MDKSLFKDLYLFELDRRDKLGQGMNSLITGLTVVGGLLGYFLQKYTFGYDPVSLLVTVLLLASVASFAVAVYNTTQYFQLPKEYHAIPTSSDLRKYYQELLTFHAGKTDVRKEADTDFEDYLNERYAEATDINSSNNYYRGDLQRKAFTLLTYSVMFVLASLLASFLAENLP